MTQTEKNVRSLLSEQRTLSAAMRHIEKMISSEEVEFESEPPLQTAENLRSLWSVRLWGSVIKGRRILGLRDFVRRLSAMPAPDKVRQLAITQGTKTGLVFVTAQSQKFIGAVFSAPSAADLRKAEENFAFANGIEAPKFLVRTTSH